MTLFQVQGKRDVARYAMARDIATRVPTTLLFESLVSWIASAAQAQTDADYWRKRAERAERKLKK